jgi:predicted DNA-binding WGR domain protein
MIIAYLERHHDEKNMHRFYRLTLCPTLFGQYALIREWGRCSDKPSFGKRGQRKEDWFDQETQAHQAAEKLKLQKCRKGYQLKLRG